MEDKTRRGFLIMAGVGAAATAGVVATTSGSVRAEPAQESATVPTALPETAAGALVAYVSDVRSGRVSVMVGESEVVVSDPDLVARLAHAATGKKV
jgi:hypothetical protein